MKRGHIILLIVCIAALAACEKDASFTLKGTVSGAAGKTLYLTHVGMGKIEVLDSIPLDEVGNFNFSEPRPECYDFYRLQLGRGIINIAIDSTETITVNANANNFSKGYTVKGSENNAKIKELVLMQMELQQQVNGLIQNSGPEVGFTREKINDLVNSYKENVKLNYIYKDPSKAYSYFALFQMLGDSFIFDSQNNRSDIKCFAAVATSLNDRFPHAARAMNIYNIAVKGLRNTRPVEIDSAAVKELQKKVVESGVIDIKLNDQNSKSHKLTDLKGKVVLLDFTAYQNSGLAKHNLLLRELYGKYSGEGFQIFQVSLDRDEHFWKSAADNLPWICVRDPQGSESSNITLYGVSSLPTYFLIDRSNTIVARGENIKDLSSEIARLLKE